MSTNLTCDIFCDVIDNYGDAGICWRLASDLVEREGWKIRLFINNLQTLSDIVPEVDPTLLSQKCKGIQIEFWALATSTEPAKIVLETFGCRIPPVFEEKIAKSPLKPIWINLEYLSAEDWIESFHCLPSIHPQLGYKKYYFYPGVTPKTGGVTIENWLLPAQKAFKKEKFLEELGANPLSPFNLFIFCYPTAPLSLLNQALITDGRPIQLLLAAGKASDELMKLIPNSSSLISVVKLPFIEQIRFDQLLWSSNTVFIRGEDSFIRAQLAAVPFIWSPYVQENELHIDKLLAFSKKFRKYEPNTSIGKFWEDINVAWNEGQSDFVPLWAKWRDHALDLQNWAEAWRLHLLSLQSLSINLCNFIKEKIKSPD